jgi:predicted tellurium resistance membrane protein TerC
MGVMITAILIGGAIMVLLADRVTEFLRRNRMYEVLGLFVLFVVGIMLLTEGAHLAHLTIFGNEIHAMTKTTFYFVIGVLLLTDIAQGRYHKKLSAEKIRKEKTCDFTLPICMAIFCQVRLTMALVMSVG